MADARALLGQIWEQFRLRGVADDLLIIEHIAAVLLKLRDIHHADSNAPVPQAYQGAELDISSLAQIDHLIREAAGDSPKQAAELLDPAALFRLSRSETRGHYPTPRHIVELMQRLCEVEPQHDLLDLACGSGGFLARRTVGPEPWGRTVGVEIAQRWARIAYANALLRLGSEGVTVLNQNALSVFGSSVHSGSFQRVLMNPPFGEKINRDLLQSVDVPDLSGRSEVVLATLALEALSAAGRAAVLLPAGPLFSNGIAETALRRRLLTSHHLRAVVALPRDAFQPFSGIQTYLIVVDRQPSTEGATWFFLLARDGYPAGQSRDLTQRPSEASDFPLLQTAIGGGASVADIDLGEHADVLARVTVVPAQVNGGQATEGVVIEVQRGVAIYAVEWYAPAPQSPHIAQRGFLLSVSLAFEATVRTVMIAPGGGVVFEEPDSNKWQDERYPVSTDEEGNPVQDSSAELRRPVYDVQDQPSERAGASGLVVTSEGVLLGRAVLTDQVRETLDPRPETWVVQARLREAQTSSAELLRQFWERQREVERHLDSLSDSTGGGLARAGARPEPFRDPDALKVFGTLSTPQEQVYRAVLNRPLLPVGEAGGELYDVVAPFRAADIADDLARPGGSAAPVPLSVVHETLGILEAMGILMRAHAAPSEHRGVLPYYRLATAWDEPAALGADPPESP